MTAACLAAQADVGAEPIDLPGHAAAGVPSAELEAVADPELNGQGHEGCRERIEREGSIRRRSARLPRVRDVALR
jgi:hypothetical protein